VGDKLAAECELTFALAPMPKDEESTPS
jgi:hypothetical protein